jgi:hypothetical protein
MMRLTYSKHTEETAYIVQAIFLIVTFEKNISRLKQMYLHVVTSILGHISFHNH